MTDTFFEQFASEWLKPGQAPELSLMHCDPNMTDQLLKTLMSGEGDLRAGYNFIDILFIFIKIDLHFCKL